MTAETLRRAEFGGAAANQIRGRLGARGRAGDNAGRRAKRVGWLSAALLLAVGAVAGVAAPERAAAQEELACANPGVRVVPVALSPAFAILRAPGADIALNQAAPGAGALSNFTREWLFERQCALAARAGADPQVDPSGYVVFSLIDHQEVDCEAFRTIAERHPRSRNALVAIDRDVSAQARGTHWDASLGQLRNVSSEFCLNR